MNSCNKANDINCIEFVFKVLINMHVLLRVGRNLDVSEFRPDRDCPLLS